MPTVSLMVGNFNTMGGNFNTLPRAGKRNTAWCYVATLFGLAKKLKSWQPCHGVHLEFVYDLPDSVSERQRTEQRTIE